MLVVLASRFDACAATLVERWRARDARLLTCEALSRRGWVYDPAAPERATAVIEDKVVPVRSIRGVFTRLSAVTEADVPHIRPEERGYVASEMTAFLVAWLSSLPCRVLNRPTPLNLAGPSWRPEQWALAAVRAGLPARHIRRVAPTFAASMAALAEPVAADDGVEGAAVSVTTVGTRSFARSDGFQVDERVAAGVRRLADAARVELLTTSFVPVAGELTFCGAAPWVDIERPEVADAVLDRLEVDA